MNLLSKQKVLQSKVQNFVSKIFDIDIKLINAEIPPKTEFGDLAFPIAFELAKLFNQKTGEKQNPRAIAEKLKAELMEVDFVQDIQIAGPGYLNVFYNRSDFLAEALDAELLPNANIENDVKICVEHTSVNPNKSAHIGHVRNSVLGDTFVRILRAAGKTVEVQNYIDNTGVQVADVVVGFIHLLNLNLADIVVLADRLHDEGTSFDYYCWDLYAKVGVEYQTNEDLKEKRAEVLHLIEEGDNPTANIAEFVATRNGHCILKTMERLSIRYDLLPRESEILHLNFWQKAFDLMKEREVIKFVEEGKMAGCWVMPFESKVQSPKSKVENEQTDEHDQDKILVRSNGTVTYTGKDIAYQMWKLGLLGMDFYYDNFSKYENGKQVWITTTEKNENEHPEFGNAETVYNVIDTRQSYPQEVVKKGVATIFPEKGEDASVHLSYEMVALSPSAAEELGFELSDDDRKKPFIEMSGRKGLGVKADDLINRLEANAYKEVSERNPEFTEAKQKQIAHEIAIGALRYFLSKFTKNTVIVFDFKEAMAFEGETGTYCQNATVRINSIFKKLDENALENAQKLVKENNEKIAEIFNEKDGNDFWSVVILAFRLEETIQQAIENTEPAYLAKYTFNLAKTSNLFYQKHRIKDEPDELKQAVMICVAEIARKSLTTALETMGIKVPERM